jgi:hypothetical protein
MEVVYGYALGMPKYVYVQLHGIEKPAKMRGDKVEVPQGAEGKYIVRLGGEQVGEFRQVDVVGWWVQDERVEV